MCVCVWEIGGGGRENYYKGRGQKEKIRGILGEIEEKVRKWEAEFLTEEGKAT